MTGKDTTRELVRYFGHDGFTRLFAAARKKYESLGRIGGAVRLTRLRDAEREKLSGLLSRNLKNQSSLTVQLQELDEILQASRFQIGLLSLFQLIFGEEIKPKSVQHLEAETAWRAFIKHLQAAAEKRETNVWLDGIAEGRGHGYRTFRDVYEHTEDFSQVKENLHAVIRGLDQLPVRNGEQQQLPIFSAMITGDPHFFDRERLWGRLFYYGLLAYLDAPEKNEALFQLDDSEKTVSYRVRKQYQQAGILLDALSSHVLVIDVAGKAGTLSYAITLDMIERFRRQWEDIERGTQEALHRDWNVSFIRRTLELKQLFVSENPSVCEAIARQIEQMNDSGRDLPSILCTSGQPSVAALELLDFFVANDVTIHYSGDLDVKGLEMAISLEERYHGHWQPWGMTSAIVSGVLDKLDGHIIGVTLSKQECQMLQKLTCRWDPELVKVLLKDKIKIFQEMFVDQMFKEYKNIIR
jgi:uncharacterized protein (TIGR02679 family)